MEDVVIVAAVRTAIGNFNGTLSTIPAAVLGSKCIEAVVKQTGVKPDDVDEVPRPFGVKGDALADVSHTGDGGKQDRRGD